MFFRQILDEDKSCATYIVGCIGCRIAAIIDPTESLARTADSICRRWNLRITDIIETHLHADHVSAGQKMAKKQGAKLWYSDKAKTAFKFEPLLDGAILRVGNRKIEVMHTPGHSPDSVCLLVDERLVLTGDTLFVGDVGRPDLADGDPSALFVSLQKLARLPDLMEVYPGHFGGSKCGKGIEAKPSSTIGNEKIFNEALQFKTKKEFIDFVKKDLPEPPKEFFEIKKFNAKAIL